MKISTQMPFTPKMKNTMLCAFYHRVKRFCGIVVHITSRKLFFAVVDMLMRSIAFADLFICRELIGHQDGVVIDQTDHPRFQGTDAVIINQCRPHWTVSFNGDQNSLFLGAFTAFVADTFLEPGFSANVLLIEFNNTTQSRDEIRIGFHHFANGMANFPRAFLRNTNQFA